jgi:hypothetical protein
VYKRQPNPKPQTPNPKPRAGIIRLLSLGKRGLAI